MSQVQRHGGQAPQARQLSELVPTTTINGELRGVYCDQLGGIVYRAGCFRDTWV
jgi:hypothetical protein